MPTNLPGSRVLYVALARFQRALGDDYGRVSDQITGILLRYGTGPDGTIPPASEPLVLSEVERVIERTFVGPDGRNPYAADGRTPLAPYPTILNESIEFAIEGAVKPHADYMRAHLGDDVVRWLTSGRSGGNRLPPTYEAPHTWVDPNGYRLSDRVWQGSLRTRLKIDALLSDHIRRGVSARDIAKGVERFLLPGRAAIRTNKPYSSDASFDAMRLARSEITRAHGAATLEASRANPFVSGMDWKLSIRHPKVDICDDLATIGMDGQRLREPYPLEGCPSPVQSSHPQCLCSLLPSVAEDPAQIAAMLRERMIAGQPPPFTPLDTDGFVSELLSGAVAGVVLERLFQ